MKKILATAVVFSSLLIPTISHSHDQCGDPKVLEMVEYFDCGTGDPRSISKEEHEAELIKKHLEISHEQVEVYKDDDGR